MNDKEFKKMDEAWMRTAKPLRDRQVSEGMMKGFAASVERRITPAAESERSVRRAPSLVWVPTLAVLVIASAIVLRSPVMPATHFSPAGAPVQLAQAPVDEDVQEEIELLSALGAWDDSAADAVLGDEAALAEQDMELTRSAAASSAVA